MRAPNRQKAIILRARTHTDTDSTLHVSHTNEITAITLVCKSFELKISVSVSEEKRKRKLSERTNEQTIRRMSERKKTAALLSLP